MSQVNRILADGLDQIGIDVMLQSINMAENKEMEFSENYLHLTEKENNADIEVRHFFPPSMDDWDENLKVKIAYLPVETTPPDEWIKKINANVDYVWTYSQHGKDMFEKYGCKKPVYVMPCGVDTRRFHSQQLGIDFGTMHDSYTKKLVPIDDDTFVFTFAGHAQKRKNLPCILRSYFKEFTDKDNVLLVIKSYDGGEVSKLIADIYEEVWKEGMPRHLYIYEDSSPEKIARIYTATDCMVLCSRAEGYGWPILEAMACGTPSIAIAFSGPKDFCTEENSYLVPFTLVKSDYHVQSDTKTGMWAKTPDESLMETMRRAFNDKDISKKSKACLETVKDYGYLEGAWKVAEFLKDIKYI